MADPNQGEAGLSHEQGVTRAADALGGASSNVVAHTYTPKLHTDNAFVWHAVIPAGTFVPPHIHPTQDEWIIVIDGALEIEFGADRSNPLAEVFSYPNADAYGSYLASTPQYVAS